MLIASVASVAGLVLILRPDAEPQWPRSLALLRLAIALVILVLCVLGLDKSGFLLPTALASAALSYLIKPNLKLQLLAGIGVAGGLFLIFKYALGLSLFALPRWVMGY